MKKIRGVAKEKYNKYIEIMSLPYEERRENGLLTKVAIAREVGITVPTLYEYEKRIEEEDRIVESGSPDERDEFLKSIKPFALSGKNSRYADLYSTIKGWKVNKIEEKHTVEFSHGDRITLYREFLEWGRREAEESGFCPMCHQPHLLLNEPRTD